MKYIKVVCLTLLVCIQCLGQDATTLIKDKQLKKGFYKTYQEYLDNNPSILAEFTTKVFRASKKDTTIIAGSYDLTGNDSKIKKNMGFLRWGKCFCKV